MSGLSPVVRYIGPTFRSQDRYTEFEGNLLEETGEIIPHPEKEESRFNPEFDSFP